MPENSSGDNLLRRRILELVAASPSAGYRAIHASLCADTDFVGVGVKRVRQLMKDLKADGQAAPQAHTDQAKLTEQVKKIKRLASEGDISPGELAGFEEQLEELQRLASGGEFSLGQLEEKLDEVKQLITRRAQEGAHEEVKNLLAKRKLLEFTINSLSRQRAFTTQANIGEKGIQLVQKVRASPQDTKRGHTSTVTPICSHEVSSAKTYATPADAKKAFDVHSSALSTDPSAAHHIGRAMALLSLGRPREALSDAKAAVKLEPMSCCAFVCKARVYQYLAEFDKALSVVEHAQKQASAIENEQQQQQQQLLRQLKAEIRQSQAVFARAEWCDLEAAPDIRKAVADRLKHARHARCAHASFEDVKAFMRIMPGLQAAGRGHAARDAGNLKEAFASYKASAEMGCADGMFNLALSYKDGAGCDRSVDQYLEWVKKASSQQPYLGPGIENIGVAGAENSLGVSYRDGVGVEVDQAQALFWFERASEHGSVEGINNFGCMLEYEGKHDGAIRQFRKAAQMGYPRAMENLSRLLKNDPQANTVEKEEASKWLRKAKGLGSSQAFLMSAVAKAHDFESFRHAADLDTAVSEAMRAVEATPVDPTVCKVAALLLMTRQEDSDEKLSDMEAKELLATLGKDAPSLYGSALRQELQRHRPLTEDETRAVALFKVAGMASDVDSQKVLASFFRSKGLLHKAKKWFERAAEAGDADAAYSLCLLLGTDDCNADHSIRNLSRSLDWLEKAVMRGSKEARQNYVSLRDRITDRQLTGKCDSTLKTPLPRATGDGSALMSVLSRAQGRLSKADLDDAMRAANALQRAAQPSPCAMFMNDSEAKRVERIGELEAYISCCHSPSPTAVHLLKALYCFKESLLALWQGKSDSIEWLCEANLWDEKACQYEPEILAEFAFLARERAAKAEPWLDIPALVVLCLCGRINDYCFHEEVYTRIIDALQSGQGLRGWNDWLGRFSELRANIYCFQGRWVDALQAFRAIEKVHGKMFRDCISTYGIGVCLDKMGDDAGAQREFRRYISSAPIDAFKMPHAHYQLAKFALADDDLASMKMHTEAAQEAEKHRIPLLDHVDKNFPLKDMMISTFRIESRKQPACKPAAPSQEVVCGHCGKDPPKLMPCTCRAVFYCGIECQKANWKVHKRTCSARGPK